MAKNVSDVVKPFRPKPSLSLDSRDFKEIKDCEIGKTYTFTVQAKVISLSKGDEYDDSDDNITRGRFRVLKVNKYEDD